MHMRRCINSQMLSTWHGVGTFSGLLIVAFAGFVGCCSSPCTEYTRQPPDEGPYVVSTGTEVETGHLSAFGIQALEVLGRRLKGEAVNSKWFQPTQTDTPLKLLGMLDYLELDTGKGGIVLSDNKGNLDASGSVEAKSVKCQVSLVLCKRQSNGQFDPIRSGLGTAALEVGRTVEVEALERWRAKGNLSQEELNKIRVNEVINVALPCALNNLIDHLEESSK